jgi:4-amino-4-deoxy-L-arabinose transferase-like glycosyltransferase
MTNLESMAACLQRVFAPFQRRLASLPPVGGTRHEALVVAGLIVLIWAVALLPHLSMRAFIYEEGRNAELARTIATNGNFLEPSIYGERWVEKPSLLPWLIVAASHLTGGVEEWSARLPTMLSVLLTALLIYYLIRRYASLPISLFAAASYVFCPLLLQKLTVAEPDTLVSALSFAAFVVWWDGEETGRVAWWRWLGAGLLLAALAMAKGPEPLGFFAIGVASYLLLRRRWGELPGMIVCLALPAAAVIAWGIAVYHPGDEGNWMRYMRVGGRIDMAQYWDERLRFVANLPLELLPSSFLLPFLARAGWRRELGLAGRPILAALGCYAGLCALALLIWPGVGTRYAMPIGPAVAILGALVVQGLWPRRHLLARIAVAIVIGLLAYQVVLTNAAVLIVPGLFAEGRLAGEAFGRAIAAEPAPVYCANCDATRLFYVGQPIRKMPAGGLLALAAPAWLLTDPGQEALIAKERPDLVIGIVVNERSNRPKVSAIRLAPKS